MRRVANEYEYQCEERQHEDEDTTSCRITRYLFFEQCVVRFERFPAMITREEVRFIIRTAFVGTALQMFSALVSSTTEGGIHKREHAAALITKQAFLKTTQKLLSVLLYLYKDVRVQTREEWKRFI